MTATTATTLEDAAQAALGTMQRAEFTGAAGHLTRSDDDGDDGRTLRGIGVPYGVTIEHLFGRETFDPGSIEDADTALILWQHDTAEPIGRVSETDDTPEAMNLTARLSQTRRADEALTLNRDGVLTGLSIGFEPREYRITRDEDGTETLHWTRVRAREFSLVSFPAYETARTRSTLERTTPMPTTDTAPDVTRDDLDTLAAQVTDLDRRVQLIPSGDTAGGDVAALSRAWPSIGGFVKDLARGDDTAANLYNTVFGVRAEGGTTADIPDTGGAGWLGAFIRMIEDRRRVANLFSRGPLPANGMSVDYAQYSGNTLTVGEQSAELADLPGPGKLAFTTETEPIKTYGGWTELSRQVIERADVPYLDTVWKALGLRYAAVTDKAVRDRVLAEVAGIVAAGEAGTTIEVPATPTVFDWLDAIVDAGDHYAATGFDLSALLVDKDTFKSLVRLEGTDGRPLMTVYGAGVNVVGEVNLPKGDGTIARVPVHILWGAPAGTRFFSDPAAVELRESSGAPVRLQDENIVNLSKAFSLYGYAAVTVPFPGALVPVVDAAV